MASPRPDREAEWLALSLTEAIAAPDNSYDRVARDLVTIRATQTELADIHARVQPWVDSPFLIRVDATTIEAVRAGTYHAWDCMNAQFGVTRTYEPGRPWTTNDVVALDLAGRRLKRSRLREAYLALPGVLPDNLYDGLVGDGDDICAATRNSDELTFVFKRGRGDCPSGCTEKKYWGVSTDAAGNVHALGYWELTTSSPRPDWFPASCDRFF